MVVALVAFVTNMLLDYLYGVLARHNWFNFYLQALSGFISVLVALLVRAVDPGIDSSRVVVSVIIVMLAGMTSTGAIQDAITGWYLTALGRIFEAVMNTIGLIVGIKFGMLLAERWNINLTITPNVSMGSFELPVMLGASALVATSFSFVAQNPRRIILPIALLSAISYAVYSVTNAPNGANVDIVWSSAAAAFVVGLIAVVYTQWLKAPAAAFAICAILPLLPGLTLYQGLSSIDGLTSLTTALGVALALAGGLTFGEYVASLVLGQLRFLRNRFFAPLFEKPFASRRPKSGTENDEK